MINGRSGSVVTFRPKPGHRATTGALQGQGRTAGVGLVVGESSESGEAAAKQYDSVPTIEGEYPKTGGAGSKVMAAQRRIHAAETASLPDDGSAGPEAVEQLLRLRRDLGAARSQYGAAQNDLRAWANRLSRQGCRPGMLSVKQQETLDALKRNVRLAGERIDVVIVEIGALVGVDFNA